MRPSIASATCAALVLATALLVPAQAVWPGHLAPLLVEVHPDPEGPDLGAEWFELFNPTPRNLSLDGWAVTDFDACSKPKPLHYLNGTVLPPSGRVVIVLPAGTSCLRLVNAGDELSLLSPDGLVVQTIGWGPGRDVPAPAEGVSVAACAFHPLVHTDWRLGAPTRGTANAAC